MAIPETLTSDPKIKAAFDEVRRQATHGERDRTCYIHQLAAELGIQDHPIAVRAFLCAWEPERVDDEFRDVAEARLMRQGWTLTSAQQFCRGAISQVRNRMASREWTRESSRSRDSFEDG